MPNHPKRFTLQSYRAGLPSSALVQELGRLVTLHRRAEALLCRYLADFADLFETGRAPEAKAYSDVYHAARCLFGIGVRSTRERVRIGRALRELPRIERAFETGEIGYGRVREVTRVATARNEQHWLSRASELSMRELERAVVVSGGRPGAEIERDLAQVRWMSPETVEIRLRLRAEDWALLERAMQGARRAADGGRDASCKGAARRAADGGRDEGCKRAARRGGRDEESRPSTRRLGDWSISDSEALGAVARDALARQTEGGDPSDPRRAVVLYECRTCARTELETGRGAIELEGGAAATLACGAPVRDLRTEGQFVARSGPLPAAIRRAVLLRDRGRCRVPGCGRRRYVDVHHIESRSRGGEHSRKNCITLCDTHHRFLHDGALTIEGDADGEIRVVDAAEALVLDQAGGAHSKDAPGRQGGLCHNARATQLGSQPDATPHSSPNRDAATQLESLSSTNRDAATQLESQISPNRDTATQLGSPLEAAMNDWGSATDSPPVDDTKRILHVMGARGGWDPDALCETTGLSIPRVLCALLHLELEGRVRREAFQYQAS